QTVRQLEHLARVQGTTLFTVVLAAYAATLSRLAGQNEIVIGAPVAGRNHASVENLVGFLLNTLALPISVQGECSGLSLIARTRQSVEDALEDQDLPFERLLEGLNLSRSMVNTPVFQAMFAFQSDATPSFSFQNIACQSQAVDLPTSKFDLTLHLSKEQDGTLKGDFEFDQDLFDQASVANWVKAFCTLTSALCQYPEQPIALLPIMDSETQACLIRSSAGDCLSVEPSYLVFTQAFEEQVKRTPGATALISDGEVISYRELDEASNQLARYILNQGTQTDQIVGILIDRSPAMIIAIIATIKAGAAYLPLDTNYPTARLSYMLSDSRAVAFLCTRNRYEAFNADINVESLPQAWIIDDVMVAQNIRSLPVHSISDTERSSPVTPDNLVYVMYTSGSTGKPKGVSFLHGALGNLVKWKEHHLPADTPRVLQYSPVGFDASAQEIASALTSGAALVLVDEQCRRDSRTLLEHMHAQQVQHLFAPFVVLSSLAEARNSFDHPGWPDQVFTAGEQLQITPEIRSAFITHPESRLHNFYGPTEAHVVSNFSMPDDPKEWAEFPPIGKPISNTQLYILDQSLNLVPDGIVGELYIAGIGLARGYLGKPGMTAEKFIACPFTESGARMYRSGDLARKRNDQIDYLGRVDEQVKLRGFRIEMGEIESALLKYFECFAQVAVIARDVNGIKSLVTYFVTYPQQTAPQRAALRTTLAAHLPEYMVPSYFLEVVSLPLTPNGKLDRRALPLPEARSSENIYRAPSTENETLLCELFSEVTGTELVSVDDSFFSIGGHSLLAMRLIARMRTLNGTVLPLRTLFEFTTPETLAPHLESLEDDDEPMLTRGFGRITEN
ncbi:MAG: amino acid adenylation domain-containing protein, partial [Sheuella sp.]|nr:amino acid adenylation domain-containing protein [Sheuella sp.]